MRISISGPGECGKDSVAQLFKQFTNLRYHHSTSYTVHFKMYREILNDPTALETFYHYLCRQDETQLGKRYTLEDFLKVFPNSDVWYALRNKNRPYWADWIDRYNRDDAARLYRETLVAQDILTGIRKVREFKAARPLFDLSIWVEQPNIKIDPTQEYGAELCDIIILNEKGAFNETVQRVRKFCRTYDPEFINGAPLRYTESQQP